MYSLYETILVEWLENDWKEATIREVWGHRYLVELSDSAFTFTVEEHQMRKLKNENESKFFG